MIKDIVLHLSADTNDTTYEVAANYAVSVAEAFGAHLAAITFAHEPVLPATLVGGVLPVDLSRHNARLPKRLARRHDQA
jgi:hypothetical protein